MVFIFISQPLQALKHSMHTEVYWQMRKFSASLLAHIYPKLIEEHTSFVNLDLSKSRRVST